ncbi:hypothetical protein [Hymenobacter sp. GOD-10R]|uniref:hypothetical protein n=1 Tax=Hymenobacter sp. GOD-10R TaxID=3093922 RepID=UPI002D76EB1B|nr:hypothetical protein [Hymenobacter sp. GOD-10R]WRQ27081.1 hypothetical protein SD425_18570 [Hymenobacter sp. GOD-10R]
MINLVDSVGPYELASSWHEVTTRQYCALAALTDSTMEHAAACLVGRPVEPSESVLAALAFLRTEPPTTGGPAYPLDLGQETYVQAEQLRMLASGQPLPSCFGQLYGLFVAQQQPGVDGFDQQVATDLGAACLAWPITDTYPAVRHCLSELQRLTTQYAKLAEPCLCVQCRQPRPAQASQLALPGYALVIGIIADKLGTDPLAVAAWSADTVYQHLLQERLDHEQQVGLA